MKSAFATAHMKMTEAALAAGAMEVSSLHLHPVRCSSVVDIEQYKPKITDPTAMGSLVRIRWGGAANGC